MKIVESVVFMVYKNRKFDQGTKTARDLIIGELLGFCSDHKKP